MSPSSSYAAPTMKLLIDTGSQRVLFAEAGKDVVDFIFGLVAMPLGAVDRLLRAEGEDGLLGSIANVYASVEKMDAAYMQSKATREALLLDPAAGGATAAAAAKPSPSFSFYSATTSSPSFNFYTATPSSNLTSSAARRPVLDSFAGIGTGTAPPVSPFAVPLPAPAPNASTSNLRPAAAAEPNHALPRYLYRCDACHASRLPQGTRGFVQDLSKYTVMDDLTVTPTSKSNVSSVALLKSLGIKDLDALEERSVNVGHQEAMAILKAALHSKTVLTDAFLTKRRERPSTATTRTKTWDESSANQSLYSSSLIS